MDLLQYEAGEKFLKQTFKQQDLQSLYQPWYKQTGEAQEIYPSQGLLLTEYDGLHHLGKVLLSEEKLHQTLKLRRYLLEIFNHPQRLEALAKVQAKKFSPPQKISSKVMTSALANGLALSISELGLQVKGATGKRIARRNLLLNGPFIKLGKYARIPFSDGAMPDIFGAPAALATMAESHALACIPRNGCFSNITRQADLAKATLDWLANEPLLQNRSDKNNLLKIWQQNVVGVIEPEIKSGLLRAKALYQQGIRSFRVYSPEPGIDALYSVEALRKTYGDKIEIFVGQLTSVEQAKKLESAGADGFYAGIGGGGRCITAVRSSSVVDWPDLVWQLRGEVNLPIIVEGGASNNVGVTLALGASGIGVTRSAGGGTIESPGGLLYLIDKDGLWFKPYGGEASARTKYQDGKMMACKMPAFVEGETTKALKVYIGHHLPTITQNMFAMVENVILSLVFRGCDQISTMQNLDPSPLRQLTQAGIYQQHTH